MSQLAIQQHEETTTNPPPTHSYNLRERPTGWKEQITLAISEADKITGENKGFK